MSAVLALLSKVMLRQTMKQSQTACKRCVGKRKMLSDSFLKCAFKVCFLRLRLIVRLVSTAMIYFL